MTGFWRRIGDGWERVDTTEEEQERLTRADVDEGTGLALAVHVTRHGAENPGAWGSISPAVIVVP